LFGKPDFVFPKLRLAVFVDGCFWHRCPRHAVKPKQNAAFWRRKISANKARDRLVSRTLRRQGWSVLRIWEHELARKHERRVAAKIRRVLFAPSSPVNPAAAARVNRLLPCAALGH
jgi:DNA mismatch endonuclease (patch repair protein)